MEQTVESWDFHDEQWKPEQGNPLGVPTSCVLPLDHPPKVAAAPMGTTSLSVTFLKLPPTPTPVAVFFKGGASFSIPTSPPGANLFTNTNTTATNNLPQIGGLGSASPDVGRGQLRKTFQGIAFSTPGVGRN